MKMEVKRYKAKNPNDLDSFRDVHSTGTHSFYYGINRIGFESISQRRGLVFNNRLFDIVEGKLRIGMEGENTSIQLVGKLNSKSIEDRISTSYLESEDVYRLIGFLVSPRNDVHAYYTLIKKPGFSSPDRILTFARTPPSREKYEEITSLPIEHMLGKLE